MAASRLKAKIVKHGTVGGGGRNESNMIYPEKVDHVGLFGNRYKSIVQNSCIHQYWVYWTTLS